MKEKRKKVNRQGLRVIPGEGKRFSFRTFRQALLFYLVLLIALVVIAQLGYHWLGEQFLAWRLRIVAAEPGEMIQEIRATGLISREENVIYAPADGFVLRLHRAGERVPGETTLVTFGVLARADFIAMQGDEEKDPDPQLWDQVSTFWQNLVVNGEEFVQEVIINGEAADGNDQPAAPPDLGSFLEILVISSEEPGFVSYYVDGWEDYDRSLYLAPDYFADQPPGGRMITEGDLVGRGEPLAKLVNNWAWFCNLVLPLHPGRLVAARERAELLFDFAPENSVTGYLERSEIDETDQVVRLTYRIEEQLVGFDQARWATAALIYSRQQGIIVPAEALTTQHGQTGLFINQGGRVVFNPITILARQEAKAMVEGLAPFSLVITRPDLVIEGQRLN